jgi:hypothetical protein
MGKHMENHMENHTENLRTSRMLEGKQVLKSCTSEGFIVAFGKKEGTWTKMHQDAAIPQANTSFPVCLVSSCLMLKC